MEVNGANGRSDGGCLGRTAQAREPLLVDPQGATPPPPEPHPAERRSAQQPGMARTPAVAHLYPQGPGGTNGVAAGFSSGSGAAAGAGAGGVGGLLADDASITSGLSLSAAWVAGGCSSASGAAGESVLATRESGAGGRPNPRVYEVWPRVGGRNRFLCCGRCITGPPIDFWYNCCAWSFILGPSGFYFYFCAGYLWKYVNWLLPTLTGLVLLSTIVFLLLTSCTDPGIIPRYELQELVHGLEEEVAVATGVRTVVDLETSEPRPCEFTEEQHAAGWRWCQTCKVARPPRSHHCGDCDNCVLTFDHHCPFVNNCVGQRNYGFFSMFLISTGCLGFAVITGLAFWISHKTSGHHGVEVNRTVLMVLLTVIGTPTAILLLGVLALTAFHTFLACRGRTTKEVLTGKVTIGGRTLFTLRGSSLLHPRKRVSVPMQVL